MSAQKRAYASNAALYAAFTIGAIVAVNLIGARFFGRLDLTEEKMYTLSPASKDLVAHLPDYLNIKAFISHDLPPEGSPSPKQIGTYLRDLIDEYATASKGKLRWEAIDPGADKKDDKDKSLEEEAQKCKVRRIQVQVMKSSKFELGAYFLGLCLEYGDKTEAIPEVLHTEGLEYQLSSLIKRMTQKKRKVAFTTGHGEIDLNQGLQALRQIVQQEYDSTTVNPSSADIGEDVDALVVGGPKQPFDDKGRRELDKFLMKGKGAIFLVDGMAMTTPRGAEAMQQMDAMPKIAQANDAGLDPLLSAYGFKVGQDFIVDPTNAGPGPVDVGGGKRLLTMPVFPVAEVDATKDVSIFAGVRAVIFPFASSVDLVGPLQGGKSDKGKLWRLAASTKDSWKHSGFFFFSPTMKIEEGKDKGSSAYGYAYEGPLKSAFAGATPEMSAPDAKDAPASESKKAVRLVVVGDSDFASDEYVQLGRYLPIYTSGAQMLFNAIAWTLEDEALTPVRAKTVTPRPIQTSESTVAAVKAVNIAGLPLAFCGYGILRWRVRRARRAGTKL